MDQTPSLTPELGKRGRFAKISGIISISLESFVDHSNSFGDDPNYLTLIERKSRMPQIQGIKGEAVVNYCEPLKTPKIGYHRLSLRVNKIETK